MSKNYAVPATADTTADGASRKPWAKPQVITASVSKNTLMPTFKSEPSITDYTTGTSHVGS